VDSELEVIRDEMELTRASLADKLGALEQQVRETVSGASEAVHSTVEGVKEVVSSVKETAETVTEQFSLSRQFEQHPWAAFGVSVAAGFAAAYLLDRMTAAAAAAVVPKPGETLVPPINLQPLHSTTAAGAPSTASAPSGGDRHPSMLGEMGSKALGKLSDTALDSLEAALPDVKQVMNTAVQGVSSLAVGALMGFIREMAASHLPREWSGEATKLVDQVTQQLGGKPQDAWAPPAQPANGSNGGTSTGVYGQPAGSRQL